MKYLVNRPIFHKFYMQSATIKPCRMYFTCTFQLTTFVANWWFSWHMLSFTNNFPENFICIRSWLLFCKVFWFKITRCFCFLHLNFMIVRSFFLMQWQACRSSGSTGIPVRDDAWHTGCFRTSSAISDGTGLVSRVSRLVYWALFKLLHSNWVICSSRRSLQRPVIDRLEFRILLQNR